MAMNAASSGLRRGHGTVPQETFFASLRDTERYNDGRLDSNQGQSPGFQQSSYHSRTLRYQTSFPEGRQFDTDSMYRMPPSEPIYLDIDPTIVPSSSSSRRSRSSRSAENFASRSSPNSPSVPTKPYTSRQPFYGRPTMSRFQPTPQTSRGTGADLRRFNPYGSYAQPVSPREVNRPQPSPSLIMFGDDYEIGSVATGSSQQSLLQRRRDVKKRREKKYSTKKKKKKKDRIVSIPSSLLSSSREASMISVGSSYKGTFHEKPINNNFKSPKKSQWILPRLYCSPDETGTTESSTHDMIGEEGIVELHNETRSVISLGEHSFPLLSTNAAEGLPADVKPKNAYPIHPPLTKNSQARRIEPIDDSANYRPGRRIRFAAELEQHREIPLPYSESNLESVAYGDNRMLHTGRGIPEKTFSDHSLTSDRSPTSVADIHSRGKQSSFSADHMAPRELFNKSFKPKSILRNKRHDKQGRTSREGPKSSDADQKGRLSESSRRSARLLDRQRLSMNSPPPVFLDSSGRELSPIRTSTNQEDFVVPEPHLDDYRNNILKSKSFPEDDSGNSVDAFFIHSVAAIVVQTAVRRFLAMLKIQRLRIEALRQTAKRSQGTHLSSKQDFQDMQQRMYFLAAVQIQSAFRGWWVRDSISVDTYCVILIQKVFRGFRARMEYLYDVFRITLVQSICRRWLAVKLSLDIKTENRIRNRRPKPIAHRVDLTFGRRQHASASAIQARWRAHQNRRNFIQSLSNILIVQSVARRWLAIKQEGSRLSWKPRVQSLKSHDVLRRGSYSNARATALEHESTGSRAQKVSPVKRSQMRIEAGPSRMWGRSIDDEKRSANHAKQIPATSANQISRKHETKGGKEKDTIVATLEAFRRTRSTGIPPGNTPGIQQTYSSETFNTYEFGDADAPTSGTEQFRNKAGATATTPNLKSGKKQHNAGDEITNTNRMTSQETVLDRASEPGEKHNSDDPGTTRSLLNSWKLKEKQNAYTIQPRKNLLQK